MTTIAFRDGTLAADTRAYSGDSRPIGQKKKIFRLNDGSLAGVSTTNPGLSEAFIDWLNSGCDPEVAEKMGEKPNFQALVIALDGTVMFYSDSLLPSGPMFGNFFATGSGSEYALGALSCGATAEAACLVAAQHDAWTNDQIQTLALNEVIEPEPVKKPTPKKSRAKSTKTKRKAT